MAVSEVVPGLWQVTSRFINSFLLDAGDGLTLIDAGLPGNAPRIVAAIRRIGRQPADVRRIAVTHCHSDHAGGLAELKRLTGAPAVMHPTDAEMVRLGKAFRPLEPAPGLLNAVLSRVIPLVAPARFEPAEVERDVQDGETITAGLRAIQAPGHCAGQIALFWAEHGGVLIAADAAANVTGLGLTPVYEDLDEGRRSLAKLSSLDFQVACFGHGEPIRSGAAGRFRREWPAA